ncbi:MAG: hypothetical protein KJ556_11730 [Gammaproteobacteria bacterium]|nr:hypothetical protein [Gammaproteobacteria bacterium]MBU2059956.1 hypothetical protein [Gammaproteobacteria bacterium]MBU2175789.1 hypothetical protein [Gammaproteobacteria bacterium]MBU2247612.1 hypothetical protein [Gammaproteobacteria bacterium]MBU2342927.1 hypothetical protein [Gammaproteobacteria bacterium]
MNRNRGRVSRVTLLVLISLLLFKGVAAAAMLCCGPDHSEHQASHSQSSETDHSMVQQHGHHSVAVEHNSMPDGSDQQVMDEPQLVDQQMMMDTHQLSCSGCAVSCAAAVLMVNPSDFMAEPAQNERILGFTPLVFPLTASGLERPPRLYS